MFSKLIPSILGWLVVVITLALGPTIMTYNTAITTNVAAATNASYMIGMTAIDDFGGFLIVFGLLIGGGLFAVAGMRQKDTTIGDMIAVIASVIMTVVAMALFSGSVIGYIDSMITAASGFAKTAFGILTIILYIGIIGAATATLGIKAARKFKGNKKNKSSSGSYM